MLFLEAGTGTGNQRAHACFRFFAWLLLIMQTGNQAFSVDGNIELYVGKRPVLRGINTLQLARDQFHGFSALMLAYPMHADDGDFPGRDSALLTLLSLLHVVSPLFISGRS